MAWGLHHIWIVLTTSFRAIAIAAAFIVVCAAGQAGAVECEQGDATLVGFAPGLGAARDVVIDETAGIAYVASDDFGLSVIDVGDPNSPVVIGNADEPFYGERLARVGSLVVVSSDTMGARVLDISDPTAPVTLSQIQGDILDVAADGGYVYLLVLVSGNPAHVDLTTVDLSDPRNPRIRGQVNIGFGTGVDVQSGYAYVAGGPGLVVVDVGNPVSPAIAADLQVDGGAQAIDVNGSRAYLGNTKSFNVIDVSNPRRPSLLGSLPTAATALRVSGNTAYAIAGETLKVIDVTLARLPLLIGQGDSFNGKGLDVSQKIVFVATPDTNSASGDGGLYLLDLTLEIVPIEITNVYTGFDNLDLAVVGSVGLLAGGELGLQTVDLSVPERPEPIGSMSGTITDATAGGGYGYVLEIVPGNPAHVDMVVLDVSTGNPVEKGRVNVGIASTLVASGPHVFVGGGPGLEVVDVSKPTRPTIVADLDVSGGARGIAIENGFVYLGNTSSLNVVDVRQPTQPQLVESVPDPATAVFVSGSFVYTLAGDYFRIYDASNPFNLILKSNTSSYGAQDLAIRDGRAYLPRASGSHFDGVGGVYVVDVSNASNPRLLQRVIVPGSTRAVVLTDRYVLTSDNVASVDVIDPGTCPPPSTLTVSGSILANSGAGGLGNATAWASTAGESHSDDTDSSGAYSVEASEQGEWTVTPSKWGDLNGAISSLDAAYILEFMVDKRSFTNLEKIACDVTGNGDLSSLDATRIMDMALGRISRLPAADLCGSDWLFSATPDPVSGQEIIPPALVDGVCQQGAIRYSSLSQSISGQDFTAIPFGDCSGNWQAGGGATGDAPVVSLGRALRTQGRRLRIPVYVRATEPVRAIDLRLQFDPDNTRPLRPRRARSALRTLLRSRTLEPGVLAVAVAGADAFAESGPAFWIEVDRRRGSRGRAPLSLQGARVNERPARTRNRP